MHVENDSVGIGLYDVYTVTVSEAIAEPVAIDAESDGVTDNWGDLLADLRPVLVRLMSAEAVLYGDTVVVAVTFILTDPVMVPRCVAV